MSIHQTSKAALRNQLYCTSEECFPFVYDLPVIYEEECRHLNCVEDENLVCTDCGLVLSSIFAYNDKTPQMQEFSSIYRNKVHDLAHILHLDHTAFTEEILFKMHRKPACMRDDEALVFYAYEYLTKAKNYIKFSHLCQLCGVNEKKMAKYTPPTCGFEGDELISKASKLFNLTYSEEKLLADKMATKQLTGHAPLTILGGFLYILFGDKIPLKKICSILNINSVSVRRYVKTISNKHTI